MKKHLTDEEKKERKAITRRLRDETKQELLPLCLGTCAMVASSLSNQAIPRLMASMIDKGNKPASSNQSHFRPFDSALALVVLGGGMASFVRTYSLKFSEERIAGRLRKNAFASLLKRNLEWFQVGSVNEQTDKTTSSGLSPGAIEEVLTDDVDIVAKSRTTTLANMARSCSSIFFSTYHMLQIDSALFGVSLSVVPLLGAAATLLRRSIKHITQQKGVLSTRMASFIEERLTHINVVQMANREEHEISKYNEMQDESLNLAKRFAAQDGMFMGFLFAASSSALLMVVNLGGISVASGKMTSGQLTSFATYSFLLGLGTSGLMRGLNELSQSMIAAERYYRLIADDEDSKDFTATKSTPQVASRSIKPDQFSVESVEGVAFRNVSFTYQSTGKKVLDHVSFEIQRGKIFALVGKNGSGKSTVSGLLAGLYQPSSGQIESSDGADLTSLDAATKKALVQVVPQSVALFNMSILENIRYSKNDATVEEVKEALTLANCNEFVDRLEGGINFVVGRNGDKLSGGERQRLALARALLSKPAFLILDEPGSNLDAEGETAVNEALVACRNGQRALLLITHNSKNLDRADMVLVLDQGRIIEAGHVNDLRSNPNSALARLMPGLNVSKDSQ